jgi:hypothetical protein
MARPVSIVAANVLPLDSLYDVVITSPVAANILRYNGSSWVNASLSADDLTDVAVAAPATAQVLRYNGTNWVNAQLQYADLGGIPTSYALTGASGADLLTLKVTADTQQRLILNADGPIEWGSGALAVDTNLYRSAPDTLKTDDFFIANAGLSTKGVEIDPSSGAAGTLLRHNGTKYVSVAEESVAQYPNVAYVSAIVNGAGTTSSTMVDVPNISVSFTKNKAGTKVLFEAQWSWYNTNAGGTYYWGFQINGTDYQVFQMTGTNLASTRLPGACSFMLSGLAAGTYTVKLRYRTNGTGTLMMDSGDVACMTVTEVK